MDDLAYTMMLAGKDSPDIRVLKSGVPDSPSSLFLGLVGAWRAARVAADRLGSDEGEWSIPVSALAHGLAAAAERAVLNAVIALGSHRTKDGDAAGLCETATDPRAVTAGGMMYLAVPEDAPWDREPGEPDGRDKMVLRVLRPDDAIDLDGEDPE